MVVNSKAGKKKNQPVCGDPDANANKRANPLKGLVVRGAISHGTNARTLSHVGCALQIDTHEDPASAPNTGNLNVHVAERVGEKQLRYFLQTVPLALLRETAPLGVAPRAGQASASAGLEAAPMDSYHVGKWVHNSVKPNLIPTNTLSN